jgi:hypothetical protein
MKLLLTRLIPFFLLIIALSACDSGGGSGEVSHESGKAIEESPVETVVEKQTAGDGTEALVWVPGWREGPPLSVPRSGAAIMELNGIIHVIGGVDGKDFLRTTEYAKVNSDGSLSEWQPGPSLNVERGFFAAVRHKNHVYVAGGGRGPYGKILLDTVERAEIRPDGTLGEWVLEKNIMNIERRCSRLVVMGDHIYALGGFGGILLDTVESAEILPDGTLGEWFVAMDTMKVARYIHTLLPIGERVYVIGGHDQAKGVGITDVEWSQEDEPGFFKPWQPGPSLQTGRYGLESVRHGDYVYAMGGLSGAAYLDSVEKARINPDGSLEAWEYTTPLPSRREGMNLITANDHVYVIGGTNVKGFKSSVEYATFNDQGDMGYWATPEQARAEKLRLAQREQKKRVLPNQAVVLEHIKASGYSYLVVERADGLQAWLAAPVMEIQPGTMVRFPDGVIMSNFFSKELKRNFPAIMFVSEVQVLPRP